MSERSVRRYLVSGKVQGVFFRASTREQATQLGIDGRAVNLSDGRVEVIAAGDPRALAALEGWLAQGPRHARVDEVQADDHNEDPGPGFQIG